MRSRSPSNSVPSTSRGMRLQGKDRARSQPDMVMNVDTEREKDVVEKLVDVGEVCC